MRKKWVQVAFSMLAFAMSANAAIETRDAVIVKVAGAKEETLGAIETDAKGGQRLVFLPAYVEGYCKRRVLQLTLGDGKPRIDLGRAMSERSTWIEYASAEGGKSCDASASYFEPVVDETGNRVVARFLSSMHAWRTDASRARRFDVQGSLPEAVECARSEPDLRVSAFWKFLPNEGVDSIAYRVLFSGCKLTTPEEPLEGTVTYDEVKDVMRVFLSFDQIAVAR